MRGDSDFDMKPTAVPIQLYPGAFYPTLILLIL